MVMDSGRENFASVRRNKMSEDNQQEKDFKFIQEQVIEKKHKRAKKRIGSFCITVLMAILFGLTAAFTFAYAEPGFFKFLHKEKEDNRTPVIFPTVIPDEPGPNVDPEDGKNTKPEPEVTSGEEPDEPANPVIVQKLDADINDYISIFNNIKKVSAEAEKSILTVSSIIQGKDLFGNPVDKKMETSGIIIADNNEDLLILVSYDRVKNANSIWIEAGANQLIEARLHDYDSDINLAVLAVKLGSIPTYIRDNYSVWNLGGSYSIMVGSPVIAIGSPNGYPNSMDIGIITSKGSTISITDNSLDLFNTSLNDNSNGDGVIVNLQGKIIGVITRNLKDNKNKNINTVIGITKLQSVIEKMANQNPRLLFGVKAEDMTEGARKEHKVDTGIYVNEVLTNSPAFSAGIKSGDIILQLDDQQIVNVSDFNKVISSGEKDQKIDVLLQRATSSGEKEITVTVTLAAKEQ